MTSNKINPEDIELTATPVGRDLLLVISGGVRHIGAASTAYLNGERVEVQTSAVPHHKEHTISEDIAIRVAKALNRTVTVVMGIHYDDLSKEGIMKVVEIVNNKVNQYLAQQI
ncbi:prenylated flavin chaperone LpdD [Paenibacillus sp. FSL K6-2859]|uniref:prenylated flavin chaperone LpdD n=1 Tax=Paenibacillus sp. FSL K6-2859 TaxID=2921482 RepID=UPI0030F5BBE9